MFIEHVLCVRVLLRSVIAEKVIPYLRGIYICWWGGEESVGGREQSTHT